MMGPPGRFSNTGGGGGGGETGSDSGTPSNNLWIGNLSSSATDFCLMEIFAQYGALDAASYASRSFGFVYFKRAEEAKVAKDALQGTVVKGLPIKIQFARPTKPSNQLWVGGISSSISKEELEEEFMKFGKVEEFKFLRERNIAIVQFSKVEDASQAMKKMNGKRIGSDQIRVDFLRSNSSGKETLPGFRGSSDAQFQSRTTGHYDTLGSRRQQNHPQLAGGLNGDGQPSNVLWVGYPPSIEIDEQMLHNAFILFGEIERITSFPQRHYSFVEFRSVDEARRAKEGLQGRLFNDPRITIMYSSSDIAPAGPNNFSRPPPSIGIARANIPDGSPSNLVSSNWRRPSPPAPGMIPSPSPGSRRPGGWDVFDASQAQRDPKRSRIDPSLSIDDAYLPSNAMDERRLGLDRSFGLGPLSDGSGADPYASVQGKSRLSPVGPVVTAGGRADYIWRGIIAKGGTSVCLARCVPVGKGIGSELPEIVNCSARTGLDMLAKHYTEAIGFEICYFLPDSEEDFASYTEFLCYLGGKDRAGVAKLDDGTTLFLVPPSDFLTKVLKVVGPERLYGVVLKSPQLSGNAPTEQHAHQSIPLSHSIDRHFIPPHVEYGVTPRKEQALQMDYNRFLHEDSNPPPRPPLQPTSGSVSAQSISQGYASNSTAMSQAGIGLTPELIATLTSFLPANTQNSALGASQQGSGSSTHRPQFQSALHDDGDSSQVWRHDHQQLNHSGHFSQQSENQYNAHAPHPSQYEPFASLSSTPSHSGMVPPGRTQTQDSVNLPPHHGAVPMQPLANFATPSPIGQYNVHPQVSQTYQHEFSHNTQEGYGVGHGTDATVYSSPGFQANNPMSSYNQVNSSNLGQPQAVVASAGNLNVEIPSQGQQFQSALTGAAQGTPEVEVDKNQRYQSTLQFAANLLLQIQQKQQQQQQNGSPAGHGSSGRQ